MSITAYPTVSLDGAAVGQAPTTAAPYAVDQLQITWGRSSVLEQPTPSTAAVTLRDRTPGRTMARRSDLIGRPLTLGWATDDAPASAACNFRGRVTGAAAAPRADAMGGRGFHLALAASSLEVDLGNYRVDEGTTFPAETFAARRARIAALVPAAGFGGGVTLPDRFALGLPDPAIPGSDLGGLPAAPADAGGKTVLELLRSLFASTSPLPMVYDPATSALTYAPRVRYAYSPAGLTESARLVASPARAGRYVPASLAGLHLDAGKLGYSGSLDQSLDSRITRVEVGWFILPDYEQRTTWAATSYTAQEATLGRRTLSVDSIHAEGSDATQLANLWSDVASQEGALPRLGAVSYSTAREPLADAAHAAALLGGCERGTAVFLGGSWLPWLGQSPLVRIIGGTIRYAEGAWSADLNFAPVIVAGAPSWAPVTIRRSAAAGVTLAQLDRSVTFGDVGRVDVGAGIAPVDALPYPGNPT